jgi:hypothetical protein
MCVFEQYGNMMCPYEEEDKACGRVEGAWMGIGNTSAAIHNADYANHHLSLHPYRCELEHFDMRELVNILSGGRVLRLRGDSTVRQLYNAIVCSIPLELIKAKSG